MKHKHSAVDLDEWAEHIRSKIREEFEEKGKFEPPRAFLLVTRDPKMGLLLPRPSLMVVVASELAGNRQKQSVADFIADQTRKCGALACIFASEVWTPGDEWTEERTRKAREMTQRDQSLEHMPGRGEGVIVSYQRTGTANTTAWFAVVSRDADGKATLGAFDSFTNGTVGGRFSGLMPEVN